MAILTTPDSIPTPASGQNYALTTDLAATADGVQAVITTKANYGVGTTTERTAALSRFPDGAKWYDTTLSAEYRRVAGAWVAVPAAPEDAYNYRWANAAARTAQAGMAAGDKGYQTDTAIVYRYSGSAWKEWESDWLTYTSTLGAASGGFTVGTGGSVLQETKYKWVNGRVLLRYKFVLGSSGGAVGTAPYFTAPVTMAPQAPRYAVLAGDGNVYDLSTTTNYYTKARVNDGSTSQILISSYAGTFSNITASSPVATSWASGDILQGEVWVDAA